MSASLATEEADASTSVSDGHDTKKQRRVSRSLVLAVIYAPQSTLPPLPNLSEFHLRLRGRVSLFPIREEDGSTKIEREAWCLDDF